jgi:ssRNA-specific RNase YbeY (16S rRNA maturation enzyme)
MVLCDDPHIRHLNSLHRGKDAPTDVLSFEMDDAVDYKVRASRERACSDEAA